MRPEERTAECKASPIVGIVAYGFMMGGLERVVLLLSQMLHGAGVRIVLLTACPPEEDFYQVPDGITRVCIGKHNGEHNARLRQARMKEALCAYWPDILIFHSYLSQYLPEEMAIAQSMGIKTVVHCHSAGANFFARKAIYVDVERQFEAFRSADALIALSQVNTLFFRTLGIRARYIPNPVRDVPVNFHHKPHPGHALAWIGRFDPLVKRPLDAVRIFASVKKAIPDATLTMVGDGPAAAAVRGFLRKNPSLAGAVRMPGSIHEVWQELEGADLLLLTSAMEGFPGVVAEAYAAGIPVVGYRLESAELCNAPGAYHAVAQGDSESAASVAIDLLKDPDRIQAAGFAARTAFESFASFDIVSAYRKLFDDVLCGRDTQSSECDVALYKAALSSFFALACEGRRLYVDAVQKLEKRTSWALRMFRAIKRWVRNLFPRHRKMRP